MMAVIIRCHIRAITRCKYIGAGWNLQVTIDMQAPDRIALARNLRGQRTRPHTGGPNDGVGLYAFTR